VETGVRKPVEEIAAAEEDDQHGTDPESGKRVDNEEKSTDNLISLALWTRSGEDTDRDRNDVCDKDREDRERNRYRQALHDLIHHRTLVLKALSEVEL